MLPVGHRRRVVTVGRRGHERRAEGTLPRQLTRIAELQCDLASVPATGGQQIRLPKLAYGTLKTTQIRGGDAAEHCPRVRATLDFLRRSAMQLHGTRARVACKA